MPTPTIAAIATAPGRGGVGIVRVSGHSLATFAEDLTGKPAPAPRHATITDFLSVDGRVIDQGLILYFPAPASFTGEDVLELQGHGGPVVMNLLLTRCLELGARLADPGEFTRRAFLNDKLDLAQAEAVADLIDAATASAAKSAVRSLQGEFSRAIHELVEALTELRALIEATLDFPEEEIDFLKNADAFNRLVKLCDAVKQIHAKARQGKLLQSGLSVVLIGQPNVGKSSLLNRLAGDEVAIVTPVAGTTRDALKSSIQIHGIPLNIIDTAGLRHTEDEIEQIGIARAWKAIAQADLAILLVDASIGMTAEDHSILEKLSEKLPRIILRNKIDLTGEPPQKHADQAATTLSVSAKTGQGMELLEAALLDIAGWQDAEDTFIARARHVEALAAGTEHLARAKDEIESKPPQLELVAENLMLAQNALSAITGEISADELLGEIFSRFCIGK